MSGGSEAVRLTPFVDPATRPAWWRRRVAMWAATVLVVGTVTGLGYMHFRSHDHPVAMPSVGATPAQVVQTYLDAVANHDCDTAIQLVVDPMRRDVGGDGCNAYPISDVGRMNTFFTHQKGHSRVANVTVYFHGDNSWGYSLKRQVTGAWRIVDSGMG